MSIFNIHHADYYLLEYSAGPISDQRPKGRGLHTLDFVLLLLFAEIMSSLSHETRKPANIQKEEVNLVNILQLCSK